MRNGSPVTWRVERERNRVILVSDLGGALWRGDSETGVEVFGRMAVADLALDHLELVTKRLLSHEKAQPAYAEKDMRLARISHAIIQSARPKPPPSASTS